MRYLRIGLAAVVAASGMFLSGPASAPASAAGSPDDASYWESKTEHPSVCYKHVSDGGAHGGLADGGTAVRLAPFNPSWPGDHWDLLVVKSGSGGDRSVYHHPAPGVYSGPLVSGKRVKVAHWIVCKGTVPKQPADKVEYGEWEDGVWECGDTSVTQTRTKTVTPYKYSSGKWVLDPANQVVTTESQTRPLTSDEQVPCVTVITPPSPTFVDPTCADREASSVRLPDAPGVTYSVDGVAAPGASVSVTATAQTGFELAGTVTWSHTFPSIDDLECTTPRIDAAAFSPVCQTDVPYIEYSISVSGTSATTATITLLDNNGAEVAEHSDQPLQGRLIYPGASSTPRDWPGWKFENGKWVVDPTDAHLREGLSVKVEVNPTATASVSYPAATDPCNGPESQVQSLPPTPPAAQAPPTSQLPQTGSDGVSTILGVGGLLLFIGGSLLVGARRRETPA